MPGKTQYAKAAGDVHVAYQVLGDGPIDIVLAFGFISHLDLMAEQPSYLRFVERLASFARVIMFDKRGVGLSDPVSGAPTLEERMEDIAAVMRAAGSERAVLFGISEGSAMSILFAATHPDLVQALVLYGAMPRATEAPGYPWAPPLEAVVDSLTATGEFWGEGVTVEVFAPSVQDEPATRDFMARFERNAASPSMVQSLYGMFLEIDVRDVLPSIHVPTLVLHRGGDRVVSVHAARWLAGEIPDARFVELPGIDHIPWIGDQDKLLDEVQEFLTGVRARPEPDRMLMTLMFTDIVGSTERAAELGDRRWRELLGTHHTITRRQLERHRGREIKTLGDGFLASFDGPARAIRCGLDIIREADAAGIPIRAGVHTGECEVIGDDVGGLGVHIASRVSSKAGDRELIVSRTVKDLVVGSGIAFEDRGTHRLKGVPDDWQLFAVTGA